MVKYLKMKLFEKNKLKNLMMNLKMTTLMK